MPAFTSDYYDAMQNQAQAKEAVQHQEAYPIMLQQSLRKGALDIEEKGLDVEKKQREVQIQKGIAKMTQKGLDDENPQDQLAILNNLANMNHKYAAFYREKGDPLGAMKFQKEEEQTREKIATVQEKQKEQQAKRLDEGLGLLSSMDSPQKLAEIKMSILSDPTKDETTKKIIQGIQTPEQAQKLRVALMGAKERMQLEETKRAHDETISRDKEMERHHRELEAEHDRDVADRRDARKERLAAKGKDETKEIERELKSDQWAVKDAESKLRDVTSGLTGLKGDEKKAETTRLQKEIKDRTKDVEASQRKLKDKSYREAHVRFIEDPNIPSNAHLGEYDKTKKQYKVLGENNELIGWFK